MDQQKQEASPDWFRKPNRREHGIAAGLFPGFGSFFVMMFFVQSGWWFRWVELFLAGISMGYGVKHLRGLMESKQ